MRALCCSVSQKTVTKLCVLSRGVGNKLSILGPDTTQELNLESRGTLSISLCLFLSISEPIHSLTQSPYAAQPLNFDPETGPCPRGTVPETAQERDCDMHPQLPTFQHLRMIISSLEVRVGQVFCDLHKTGGQRGFVQ